MIYFDKIEKIAEYNKNFGMKLQIFNISGYYDPYPMTFGMQILKNDSLILDNFGFPISFQDERYIKPEGKVIDFD